MGKKIEQVVFPIAEHLSAMPENYQFFIQEIKEQIQHERLKTVMSANKAMVLMY